MLFLQSLYHHFETNYFSILETGEYFVSLKGFKIPHKSASKVAPFDVNNPPPPGTEDEDALSELNDSYDSPLATDKRPAARTFEIPIQNATPSPNKPTNSSPQKPTKRSALFSKTNFLCHIFRLYTRCCHRHLIHSFHLHSDANSWRFTRGADQIIQTAVLWLMLGEIEFTIIGTLALWVQKSWEENQQLADHVGGKNGRTSPKATGRMYTNHKSYEFLKHTTELFKCNLNSLKKIRWKRVQLVRTRSTAISVT